jgi:creatinine amidohydrolase
MSIIKKVLYEELRPKEFIEIINNCPIAYLPFGTLEWHGLHLPLGADAIQAQGFFIKLAKKIGGIVLPAIFLGPDCKTTVNKKDYFGMDIHSFNENCPQQLEGSSYWIENDIFCTLLDVILFNLKRAGFKVVVAHGHGPSNLLFINNTKKFEEKYGLKLFTLWREKDLIDDGEYKTFKWKDGKNDGFGIQIDHAAFNETALVMALRPDLVDMSEITGEAVPVAVYGEDPRIRADKLIGKKIINENLNRIAKVLSLELSKIKKEKRSISYENINDLTVKPGT